MTLMLSGAPQQHLKRPERHGLAALGARRSCGAGTPVAQVDTVMGQARGSEASAFPAVPHLQHSSAPGPRTGHAGGGGVSTLRRGLFPRHVGAVPQQELWLPRAERTGSALTGAWRQTLGWALPLTGAPATPQPSVLATPASLLPPHPPTPRPRQPRSCRGSLVILPVRARPSRSPQNPAQTSPLRLAGARLDPRLPGHLSRNGNILDSELLNHSQ